MHPDELCMTSGEVSEIARFAAQAYLYAITAWRACSDAEPGVDEGVRVLP